MAALQSNNSVLKVLCLAFPFMRFTEYSQPPSGLNIIPVTAMRKMRLTGVRLYAYEKADLVFEPSFVWLKAYVVSPVPRFVNVFPVSNCLH